ncbi:MAG: hypothetical protein AB8H79_25355 [Myxococcota bacterium]
MSFRLTALMIPALAFGFSACDDDDGTDVDTGIDDLALPSGVTCAGEVCTLAGTLSEDFTLDAATTWLVSGAFFVGDDDGACPTLTIEAGTSVYGLTGQRSFIAVQRCASIEANGTKDAPILLTSDGVSRDVGDWGGLVINGKGKNNLCTDPNDCNIEGEGNSGFYGGNDDADSSGTLNYVVVTHAGDNVTAEDQLNGIAFQAVGSGTEVDYIQVHRNQDDGIEFFGGAVNVKHVVLTGIHDDSIDWTGGWRGKLQHAVVHQWDDGGDRGIEADNNSDAMNATPRSKPIISHVTLIGSKNAPEASDGMKLRVGTGVNMHSMLVVNFADDCIDVDDAATFSNGLNTDGSLNGEFQIWNSLIADCKNEFGGQKEGEPLATEDWYSTLSVGNEIGTGSATDYVGSIDLSSPDWASKGDATSGGGAPSESWFDAGAHRGGVAPGSDWTAGWIVLDET